MPPLRVPAHFFFYGTLVAGNPNPVAAQIHERLERLGPAQVSGVLHAIPDAAGWFPALLPGEVTVHGMLHRARPGFDAALLATMDAYEDWNPRDPASSLYRRKTLTIGSEGTSVEADVYLWNRALPEGAEPIPGGNFAEWLAQTGNPVFSATRSA